MNQVGRYQVLEEIGRGATGVVYRALDPAIGRTVAIKSIRLSDFTNPDEKRKIRERLLREAQAAGILSHPNIVTIYDVLESEDLAYIFMEFVDGWSLEDLIRKGTLPDRQTTLQFLRQIAEALDYAHRKGIVHRDIKPANVMIGGRRAGAEQFVKIADFGVAKLVSTEVTHNRAVIGTPSYMSPEQIQGLAVGGASDQFAMGVIVYELLCGEKPFAGESLPALFYQICKNDARPVDQVNPALNETVGKVMERALAKLPENRFSSCSEFMGALTFAIGESPSWAPIAPNRSAETPSHPGNGWHAPQTILATPVAADLPEEPLRGVFTPVPFQKPLKNIETERPRVPSGDATIDRSTRHRESLNSSSGNPVARRIALVAALLLAVIGALVFIVRMNSNPGVPTQILDSKAGPSSAPPEDLQSSAKQVSTPPADLSSSKDEAEGTVPNTNGSRTEPSEPTATKPTAQVAPAPQAAPEAPKTAKEAAPHPVAPAEPAISDVELSADPPGTRIIIDRRPDLSCLAPCSVQLAAGRHTLSAELDGFGTAKKIFSVPAENSIFVTLAKSMGVLLVTSEPSRTSVAVDGRSYGSTPVKITLPAGRHHLSLSDGARRHDETIEIDADGMVARSFRW